MTYFLDTSALIKLYHKEDYSPELKYFLFEQTHKSVILVISQLAIKEFAAATWRKTRTTQQDALTTEQAATLLLNFENDHNNYFIIQQEYSDYDSARRLVNKCNSAGYPLHTLDALQMTTAINLQAGLDGFITFDKGLIKAASFVGLPVQQIPLPPHSVSLQTIAPAV